ncbi:MULTISPECIES: DUF2516 family protein [Corynebacterium]|uniref:DUF2516 family protein n=1 Tax=Corynebacterium TaxID=1716 RepID=UPI0008A4BACD|nr:MULTISPECIES: DUF2516 family protein [Corynebacterium]MCX2162658.1 DUF2516 family protein [Corynebacterium auriscanis]WJY73660.1 hypothetical protein CAURIC_10305 [Corynebacterium auriscanis]
MTAIWAIAAGIRWIYLVIIAIVLILSIVGLVTAVGTREDAFTVIDRQKQNWLMLMGGATALSVLALFVNFDMLWIIAAVIVGIYWQDVRPGVNDALGNAGGSW